MLSTEGREGSGPPPPWVSLLFYLIGVLCLLFFSVCEIDLNGCVCVVEEKSVSVCVCYELFFHFLLTFLLLLEKNFVG